MKTYTGVGSREAPPGVLRLIEHIAIFLYRHGYLFRSGHADGCDHHFQKGVQDFTGHPVRWDEGEVYIPWNGFSDARDNTELGGGVICLKNHPIWTEAEAVAATLHPVWERLKHGPKALHTRNVFQVLGRDLKSPSAFIIYAAKPLARGAVKGGTNTAVQLARKYGIPEINLYYTQNMLAIKEAIMNDDLEAFLKIPKSLPMAA